MNVLLRQGVALALVTACTTPEAMAWSKMFTTSEARKEEKKTEPQSEKPEPVKEQKGAEVVKSEASKADTTPVVAVVNGKKITLAQVKEDIKTLPPQIQEAPFEKVFPILLDRKIDMLLITHAAENAGTARKPEVQENVKACEKATVQKAFLDEEIQKIATEDALKKEYEAFLKSLPKGQKEVRLRHILVGTEKEAVEIIKELNKSGTVEAFITMAGAKSKDASKNNGGDLGYIKIASMPEEFAKVVSKAAKATLIQKPIKTDLGFHVVRVEDTREAIPPSFAEIKSELAQATAPKFAAKVIEALRKDAKIVKYDQEGKPIVEKKEEQKKEGQEAKETPKADADKADTNE